MALKNQNQSLGFADDNRNTKPVPFLSKSKLLAYRQCSPRLWLEVNHAHAPVFEMGFRAAGVLAFADVMLPVQSGDDMPARRMVEVKSTTSWCDTRKLQTALALYMIIAGRVNRLMRLGRTLPDLLADLLFEADEWRAAFILNKNPPPKAVPTANTVIRLIAKLGGFLGRKGDGEPGAKTLWLGMRDLAVFVQGMRYARELELAG